MADSRNDATALLGLLGMNLVESSADNHLCDKKFYRFNDTETCYRGDIKNKNKVMILQFQDSNKIGMYQTIGGHHHHYNFQQDALITFLAEKFDQLNTNNKKALMHKVVAIMQERFGRGKLGSTLNGTIAWKKNNITEICTTNVGDSVSFFVALDENNQVKKVEQLNKLHDVKTLTEKEKKKLEASGANIFLGRMQSKGDQYGKSFGIEMTHAIGDNDIPGLSHIPDIVFNNYELKEKERSYIITLSDGYTKKNAIDSTKNSRSYSSISRSS